MSPSLLFPASVYQNLINHDAEEFPGRRAGITNEDHTSRTSSTNHLMEQRTRSMTTITSQSSHYPDTYTDTSPNVIVDFDGPDDPYKPTNWPFRKKIITTFLYGLTTLSASLASSIYSPASRQVARDFNVDTETSILGTSLFMFGVAAGPLLWGPLSEKYGRKPAVLGPIFVAALFAFACGAGKDLQTIFICRFFQGVFAGAPITNTGGVLGDIWTAEQRGVAIVGYSICTVGGPTLGPIIGGAIVQSRLRWRWTQYFSGIYMITILLIDLLVLDETYPAALLVAKARRLRLSTGNYALHAAHEEAAFSLSEFGRTYLVRPFKLLATPICFLMALFASFTYGIMYAMLAAFPIEFQKMRGWSPIVGALPFLAMLLGNIGGAAANLLNQRFYARRLQANNGRPVPEARLPPMMVGSLVFTAGLFVFAWTSSEEVHWLVPCMGAMLCGFGYLTVFQAALNYLIDTFQLYAASAVAATTFLRSAFGGAMPLFVPPMFDALGVDWGVSVFAFFACALIPIPFLFYVYGRRIRAKGAWSKASTL